MWNASCFRVGSYQQQPLIATIAADHAWSVVKSQLLHHTPKIKLHPVTPWIPPVLSRPFVIFRIISVINIFQSRRGPRSVACGQNIDGAKLEMTVQIWMWTASGSRVGSLCRHYQLLQTDNPPNHHGPNYCQGRPELLSCKCGPELLSRVWFPGCEVPSRRCNLYQTRIRWQLLLGCVTHGYHLLGRNICQQCCLQHLRVRGYGKCPY